MMRDITFCTNFQCKHHDCRRHQVNTPTDETMLWQSHYECNENGECESYWRKTEE